MGVNPGDDVSPQWAKWREEVSLEEYAKRWERLARSGAMVHGEADFITSFSPTTVLDAGCGTGRVAIELDRRGLKVVGVDLDDDMLAVARAEAPHIAWLRADLAALGLGEVFDVVAMPGNVMLYCKAEDRPRVVASLATHVAPAGVLIAGFSLGQGDDPLTLREYDAACASCGLELAERWGGWAREAPSSGYAVSVHRRPADISRGQAPSPNRAG